MTEVDNKGGIEFLNSKREWVSAVMLMRERVGLCKRLKREIESLQWTWLEWRIEEREWVSALNIMRGMGSLCSGHDWSGDTERDWVSLVSLCTKYHERDGESLQWTWLEWGYWEGLSLFSESLQWICRPEGWVSLPADVSLPWFLSQMSLCRETHRRTLLLERERERA